MNRLAVLGKFMKELEVPTILHKTVDFFFFTQLTIFRIAIRTSELLFQIIISGLFPLHVYISLNKRKFYQVAKSLKASKS